MTNKEIRNAAMTAAKNYGYDWAMTDYQYEDAPDVLKRFRKEMRENGNYQVCIFDGEEPYYALEHYSDSDTDLVEVMDEGEVFSESEVYGWITLGRIKAWRELLRRKKFTVGYFCDGYGAYVFFPESVCVSHLRQRGEVMFEEA